MSGEVCFNLAVLYILSIRWKARIDLASSLDRIEPVPQASYYGFEYNRKSWGYQQSKRRQVLRRNGCTVPGI
jgi:hypothetical protein